MTPQDIAEMWSLISSKLDIEDRTRIGIALLPDSQSPRDWVTRLCDAAIGELNRPACDETHCDASCELKDENEPF